MKAALAYAGLGWCTLPLHDVRSGACSCGKPDCKSAGKHPREAAWQKTASNVPETIIEWWAAWPNANVGIATGEASGFFVLDVDPDKGGDASLATLIAHHGELPHTPRARTGSGGAHYLFALPDFPVTNTAGKIALGIDTRGNGGQIVVAPSRSAKGLYSWEVSPLQTSPAQAPAWILEKLRTSAPVAVEGEGTSSVLRGHFPPASISVLDAARAALERHGPAIEGQGGDQHTVQAAAILTHDYALTDDEAWPLFCAWNETCQPPWNLEGRDSLRSKLANGRKYGKAAYGSKRTIDVVHAVRNFLADLYHRGQLNEPEQKLEALTKVRQFPIDDPAKLELIKHECQAYMKLGKRALDLKVNAPKPREVTRSNGPDLQTSETGVPHSTLANVLAVLRAMALKLWFDLFARRVRFQDGNQEREWTDADTLALTSRIQVAGALPKVPSSVVAEAVAVYARENERDPLREYFEALAWDGTRRIEGAFARYWGAEDNVYSRAASRNFFRGTVARVLRPGCKLDTMVVFEGPQGIFKSTSLRVLAGPFFGEAAESPTSKDFFLALEGRLIVEIGELESFSRAEVAAVKRVLSCANDRYRAPYGRTTENHPRRGIFVGTTNRDDWHRDETGGRRFWPIWCEKIDLEALARDREQLYAEAVADVLAGATWHEMPLAETAAEQEARFTVDPWEEALRGVLADKSRVTLSEIFESHLNKPIDLRTKADQMRLGSVLRRLGFERVDGRLRGVKTKFWCRPTSTKCVPTEGTP